MKAFKPSPTAGKLINLVLAHAMERSGKLLDWHLISLYFIETRHILLELLEIISRRLDGIVRALQRLGNAMMASFLKITM